MQANYTGNLPPVIQMPPDKDEFVRFGGRFAFLVIYEAVKADLDSAISGDRIHLDATRNECPGHFAANIFPYCIEHRLFARLQPALVMIEFEAIRIECGLGR